VVLFPNGNSYVLHLTAPLHSVIQVDLVTAKVPNSVYNLTNGSNVFMFTTSNVAKDVSVAPGYYSATGLARALVNASGTTLFNLEFLQDEGRYLLSSNIEFTLEATTSEIRRALGFASGTLTSFAASTSPVYANDTNYQGKWLYKSTKLIDLTTAEYLFLDIDELRTTSVIDAKKLVGATGTTEGATMRSTFGQVPMDVPSGTIKNFKETSDYKQYVQFTTPIPKLDRLTVRWVDHRGKLVNFQDFNNNAFTLRFHCEYRKLPEPVVPLQDVEIRRIVEAMTYVTPKEESKKRPRIPWWLILVVVLSAYVAWRLKPAPAVPAVA
jgi:hypothetical protein